MFKTAIALAFMASISVTNAQPLAPPAPKCAPVDAIINQARETYKEKPRFIGQLQKDGYFILLLGTDDGSTWTIISVGPDGLACLVATGTNIKPIKIGKPDREA